MLLRWLDSLLAPAPDQARVGWLRGASYAHRGVHDDERVENSQAAFAEAIRRGLGIECDVQRTRDRLAVVFHDFTLDRLTGRSEAVADLDAAELAAIGLTDSPDAILTLDALLDLVGGQVPLLIEVKSRRDKSPVALCLAVRRSLEGYRGRAAVMSFDPRVGRWFAAHASHVVRGLVMSEADTPGAFGPLKRHFALWTARPDFLAYDVRDLPSRFAAAQRARGLPLTTWTVRSPELAARAAAHADAPIAEGAGLS